MRELRVSIPFIGGITAIYTPAEVAEKKAAIAKHVHQAAVNTKSFAKGLVVKAASYSAPKVQRLSEYLTSVSTPNVTK